MPATKRRHGTVEKSKAQRTSRRCARDESLKSHNRTPRGQERLEGAADALGDSRGSEQLRGAAAGDHEMRVRQADMPVQPSRGLHRAEAAAALLWAACSIVLLNDRMT